MIKSSVIDKSGLIELDTFPDLAGAIGDARGSWNEESGPQAFVMQDEETGAFVATLLRDPEDEEVCITTYCDGTTERHRCTYILDRSDRYLRTEVSELPAVALMS